MKRLLSILLMLLLAAVPALAEAHEPHILAVEGSGISLTMDDSWFHALSSNLYLVADRASSDPCEYSDIFFIYSDAQHTEGILIFALSNRLTGSAHAPDTYTFPAFENSTVLAQDETRELLLWYPAELPDDLADTLRLPVERLIAFPGDVTFSEPTPLPAAAGFDALHGLNAVTMEPVSADILTGKKLTMVNVWATYCNPCISEMPDLAKLHADYADKGFQVVGVINDAGSAESYDAETLEYAGIIISSTGADYLHVLPGEGMFYGALSEIRAVPTTFFLDEAGNILYSKSGASNYSGWAAIIDGLLADMQ